MFRSFTSLGQSDYAIFIAYIIQFAISIRLKGMCVLFIIAILFKFILRLWFPLCTLQYRTMLCIERLVWNSQYFPVSKWTTLVLA